MSFTPNADSTRVCAGPDWAKDDHAVCVIDPDGEVLNRFTIEHTAAGLKRLVGRLLAAGVSEIGRLHGLAREVACPTSTLAEPSWINTSERVPVPTLVPPNVRPLHLDVAAYLARFQGQSQIHTESWLFRPVARSHRRG